jgi:hypothetical protein
VSWYCPDSLVTVVRDVAVPRWVTVTTAPGTTDPLGSVMRPPMAAVPDCAHPASAPRPRSPAASARIRLVLPMQSLTLPPPFVRRPDVGPGRTSLSESVRNLCGTLLQLELVVKFLNIDSSHDWTVEDRAVE